MSGMMVLRMVMRPVVTVPDRCTKGSAQEPLEMF